MDSIKKGMTPSAPCNLVVLEKQINTFFRLTSKTVIERLRGFPDLSKNPSQQDVRSLAELRNSW